MNIEWLLARDADDLWPEVQSLTDRELREVVHKCCARIVNYGPGAKSQRLLHVLVACLNPGWRTLYPSLAGEICTVAVLMCQEGNWENRTFGLRLIRLVEACAKRVIAVKGGLLPSREEREKSEKELKDIQRRFPTMAYNVIRFYKEAAISKRVIRTGVTLKEAQTHCRDPESSSSTCTNAAGRRRTKKLGAWFDGYGECRR